MRPQEKRLMAVIAGSIVVGALFGAGGYYLASKISPASSVAAVPLNSPYIAPVSTTSSVIVSPSSSSSATSSTGSLTGTGFSAGNSQSNSDVAAPPASVDMSDWKTYTNYELGFSFQYPPDLVLDTSNPASVTLNFPASYFSIPIAGDDTFSVNVSATCPSENSDGASETAPTQSANINGTTFTENIQQFEASTGNNSITTYTANNNDVCYTIEYNSQSSQAANSASIANILAIDDSILSTFTFVSTPAGENEADYSAQQQQQAAGQPSGIQSNVSTTSTGNGLIDLASVSTTTVSVGDNLVLTGSGFSGGTTLVWISNGSVQGVLWGGVSSSDTSITAQVPAQACTQYVGSSGTACSSYLVLDPGIYTVSVANQNGTTDPLYIHVQ